MSSNIIKQRRRTGAYILLQFAKGQLFMRINLNKNVSTNFVLIIFLINVGGWRFSSWASVFQRLGIADTGDVVHTLVTEGWNFVFLAGWIGSLMSDKTREKQM